MRRLAAIALAAAWSVATWAALPTSINIPLVVNGDGSYDTQYPDGTKPPDPPTLSCDDTAAPSLANLVLGTAYSANVRQFFSGTGAATATLSVVTVSGDDAASNGWSISGNNLINAGTTAGAGVLRIRGTVSGNSRDCLPRNWSYAVPPDLDATAPTVPTGCTSVAGDDTVTVSCDASSDAYTTSAGSGVDEYDIRLVNALGDSRVTTLTAQARGLSPQLTQNIIGSSDGTPASTQSGTDWSLSFGGTSLVGAADNVLFRSASIAGNVTDIARVASITTAATNASAGVMVRESTAAGSVFVACRVTGTSVRMSWRPTTGAARVNGTVVGNIALPISVKLQPTTDGWACSYSSTGQGWTLTQAAVNVPMASTALHGIFVASGTAGINAVAAVQQVNINNAARPSYTHSTSLGGTYYWLARDVAGNQSAYSVGFDGAPSGNCDLSGPTQTVLHSGTSPTVNTLNWNLGTWADPAGVANYQPLISATQTGTYVAQALQTGNLYTQNGLTAGTTQWLKVKVFDALGNFTISAPVSATTVTVSAQLNFVELFNSTTLDTVKFGTSLDPGATRTIQGTVTRDAPYAIKHKVTALDGADTGTDPDPTHAEIVPKLNNASKKFDIAQPWWIGFSVRLENYQVDSTASGKNYDIVFQCHATNESCQSNPMCSIDVRGGRWTFKRLGNDTTCSPYISSKSYDMGPVVSDTWVDFVLNPTFGGEVIGGVQHGSTTPGKWKVWMNGNLVVDDTGFNYFASDPQGPFVKMGIYKGFWTGNPEITEFTVYHDQLRVGRQADGVSYNDVVPR